jgi:hypothetical protein
MTIKGADLFRCYFPPMRAHALLWTRAGAEAFLKDRARPCGPYDDVIRDRGVGTGDVLAFRPAVISTIDAPSDIDGSTAEQRTPPGKTNRKAHARYQRRTFRAKIRAYFALLRARLLG